MNKLYAKIVGLEGLRIVGMETTLIAAPCVSKENIALERDERQPAQMLVLLESIQMKQVAQLIRNANCVPRANTVQELVSPLILRALFVVKVNGVQELV